MTTATYSLHLAPDPAAAGQARDALRRACPDHPRLDDAVLCLSELVTNAVLHARSPSVATVTTGDRTLRVEVRDGSRALPEPRSPDPDAVSGRGLVLLDVVADRWGVERNGQGKAVWFELDSTLAPS